MMKTVPPRLLHVLTQVYAVAAVRLLLPLAVFPMVASRLGTEEFGRLGFILVWASLLSTIVEGGFLAAATRLAVTADAPQRWRIAQQVFTARCVLCVPVALLSVVVVQLVGQSSAHAVVDTVSIAALACALGWPATWYLQATQQLNRWARVELVVYAALVAACWILALSVETFVALQLTASATLAWLGWCWLGRDLRRSLGDGSRPCGQRGLLWHPESLGDGLRLGWAMMPVSIASAAYSFALPAAASVQMTKAELGIYFMADRMVRALLSAAEPVFSVVYPRIVTLFAGGEGAALRYALAWALGGTVVGALAFALGAVAWPAAEPLLVPHAGGIDLTAMRAVLQVLGWLLPLLLGWKFIGYWMLGSRRYDTAYRACVVIGGVVGVVAAAFYGGPQGAVGLAHTALTVEVVVIAAAIGGVLLTRCRRALSADSGEIS
jgi:O-antigen/teichoic acid export membrane protein